MPLDSMRCSDHDGIGSVLLIDDNLDLGDLYTATLRWAQIGVEVAHNAEDGWTAAITRRPGLILLDIDLGETNGLDLLERLRAHTWSGPAPKIAIFTNSNNPRFRARAAAARVEAYWVKADLRLPQFVAAVEALLQRKD